MADVTSCWPPIDKRASSNGRGRAPSQLRADNHYNWGWLFTQSIHRFMRRYDYCKNLPRILAKAGDLDTHFLIYQYQKQKNTAISYTKCLTFL